MLQNSHQQIALVRKKDQVVSGDILFLISCHEIIDENTRAKFKKTLVIHASDLPHGRGWSPLIWQILEGRQNITVSLLEAQAGVDSGDIWKQQKIYIEKTDLFEDINRKLFGAEIELMQYAVDNFGSIIPQKQDSREPTYYPKRSPKDSELDPDKTIAENFNLLRVCDPERYPAYFTLYGVRYGLQIKKLST
jgi:methionyl-tRNA formyltransferase